MLFSEVGDRNTTKSTETLLHELPCPDGLCPQNSSRIYKELAVILAAVCFLLSMKSNNFKDRIAGI